MAQPSSPDDIILEPPPSKADIRKKIVPDVIIADETCDASPSDISAGTTSGDGVTTCPSDISAGTTSGDGVATSHSDIGTGTTKVEGSSACIVGHSIKFTTTSSASPSSQSQSTSDEVQPHQHSLQYWADRQKPVKEKNLKIYKIISILAIILFFPLGIPAFWNSLKLQEEFYDGIQKGDLSACNRRALTLNKLLILSFTCSVCTAFVILALIGGLSRDKSYVYQGIDGAHI